LPRRTRRALWRARVRIAPERSGLVVVPSSGRSRIRTCPPAALVGRDPRTVPPSLPGRSRSSATAAAPLPRKNVPVPQSVRLPTSTRPPRGLGRGERAVARKARRRADRSGRTVFRGRSPRERVPPVNVRAASGRNGGPTRAVSNVGSSMQCAGPSKPRRRSSSLRRSFQNCAARRRNARIERRPPIRGGGRAARSARGGSFFQNASAATVVRRPAIEAWGPTNAGAAGADSCGSGRWT